jgi:hypothetical protein
MVRDRLRLMNSSRVSTEKSSKPLDSRPQMTVLERTIAEVVNEIKKMLPPKPWHDTIRFVTFDLPVNDVQVLHWIQLLVDENENDQECRENILNVAPAMRQHEDTAMFLREIIYPFRSFFMAQIVSAVIRLDVDDGNGSLEKNPPKTKQAGLEKELLESQIQREVIRGDKENDALREQVVSLAQVHAAAHAQHIDDVLYIDTLVPSRAKELKAHISSQAKNGICTRYAQYNLIYMTAEDNVTDEAWLALMQPLAEAGLAHAQYDVGLCCLSGDREKEGVVWLERAAKLGHTRAMLELAKYHFADALRWTKSAAARSKKADNKKGNSAPTALSREELRQRTSAAMKWLDTLLDCEWDHETARDKEEARKLLTSLSADAKRYKDFETIRKQELALEQRGVVGFLRRAVSAALRIFTLRSMIFACILLLVGLLISAPLAMPADGGRFKREFSTLRDATTDEF